MGQFFIYVHNFLKGKGWLLFLLMGVFFALAIYSGLKIKTNEDFLALFPHDESFDKYKSVLRNSSFSDKIVIFFSANDTASPDKTNLLVQNADAFVNRLQEGYPSQIKDLKYKISDGEVLLLYDFFYENLPLFLTGPDYQKIAERISGAAIDTTLKKNFQLLISPAGIALKKFLLKDPFGFTGLAMEKLKQFQLDDNFTIVQNRVFSKDKSTIFIFLSIKNSSNSREMENFVGGIGHIGKSFNNPDVGFHCFGSPMVAAANSTQIKKDIYITLSITLIFIFFFLTIYFRNFFIPVLLFIPVVVGAGFSLIVIYFSHGQVSAISLGIGSVLLGIGIDYSLHLLTHYRQSGSIAELYKSVSLPILMSSITTAAAFLCLFILRSTVFQDLGFFAAVSVVSTAFAALIVLPIIFSKLNIFKAKKKNFIFPDNIACFNPEGNKLLILLVFLLSITFYFTGKRTSFNENLMDMNFMTGQLREDELYLNNKTDFVLSSLFAISEGETLEQALLESEKLTPSLEGMKNDGTIAGYFTMNNLIVTPQKQLEKIQEWERFWKGRKDLLVSSLIEKGKANQFRPEAFSDFTNLITKKFAPVPLEEFDNLIHLFFGDYIINGAESVAVVTTIKTDRTQKAFVHERLKDTHKTFLLDSAKITEGLFAVVKAQFKELILLSSIIVFVILLLAFGRIELAFVSYVPIVLSWVWTIGIMGLFNIQFNIFNVIISTFIFGLGVDYSIFITKGLLYKLQFNKDHIVIFKTSILLSGITTIFGTGVLIFAQHPAIKSIALVSVIGITSTIFITLTIQPFLFNFLAYNKGIKRALPINFFNFFFSITTLFYFLFGTIFSSFVLIPLIKLLPLSDHKRNLSAHHIIRFFAKTIVYWNLNLSKVLININNDTFSKPSLMISNHQSYIDLMFLLMLHPKIVIVANKNAWRNRFFGPMIRFADFIYVEKGLDELAGLVDERINQGYSVLIFPEGTRSVDCKIMRFHKGAFYIAKKLDLKIKPIMLYGAGEAMSKNEFFLRRGSVHIKVFDDIDLKTGIWGNNYHEHTKYALQFYRNEFENLSREVKIPKRLKHNLINRYIYRGPILEWYLRVKLMLENNYGLVNNIVPRKAVITDIGCGYGFLSTMLALVSDKRKVLGIDYDENKIETAIHANEDLENLTFANGDVLTAGLPQSDVIILSDVLHYMSKEKQQTLLEKCFLALKQNGIVIVRDADADLKKRTQGTQITEFFSTRFGFNKTIEKLDFVSGKSIIGAAKKFGLKTETIDDTKFTSNITYVLRK